MTFGEPLGAFGCCELLKFRAGIRKERWTGCFDLRCAWWLTRCLRIRHGISCAESVHIPAQNGEFPLCWILECSGTGCFRRSSRAGAARPWDQLLRHPLV